MSVVGGSQSGSKIWRRERIEMTDPDLDDVAFLSGVLFAQQKSTIFVEAANKERPISFTSYKILFWK